MLLPSGLSFAVTETTAGIRRPHTVVARRSPPSASPFAMRATAGQAGGERGFPRAGVAARGQKAECTRAVRPRVKPLPYLIRRRLNAGRSNVKSLIGAYFSHRRRKWGAGKSVPLRQGYGGTSEGVSPRGAKRPKGRSPMGDRAGRGAAEPRRKARHQIGNRGNDS